MSAHSTFPHLHLWLASRQGSHLQPKFDVSWDQILSQSHDILASAVLTAWPIWYLKHGQAWSHGEWDDANLAERLVWKFFNLRRIILISGWSRLTSKPLTPVINSRKAIWRGKMLQQAALTGNRNGIRHMNFIQSEIRKRKVKAQWPRFTERSRVWRLEGGNSGGFSQAIRSQGEHFLVIDLDWRAATSLNSTVHPGWFKVSDWLVMGAFVSSRAANSPCRHNLA
jgi:hypothetical protein